MGQKVINLYLNVFKLYVHFDSAPRTTKVEELGSVSVCGLFMGSRVSIIKGCSHASQLTNFFSPCVVVPNCSKGYRKWVQR